MKKLNLLFLLFILSFPVLAQVNFENISFAEALVKAKNENKKLFVDVFTTWCGPCKRLDSDVFANKAIGERMSKDYICLKIDNEKNPDRVSVAKYGIKAYPSMLVINPENGELIKKILGYRSAESFNDILDELLPLEQQPKTIAYQKMMDNPEDKKLWREHLQMFLNKDYTKFSELSEIYVKNFGFEAINDELDKDIFRVVKLATTNPIVQKILNRSEDENYNFGTYTYLDYYSIAVKEEYSTAKTEEERLKIREEAGKVYDKCFQELYGDLEEKDYFMNNLFPETIEEVKKPAEDPILQENDLAAEDALENEKKDKKKKKRKKKKS
jgi:thioredoxin-related protein